MGDDFYPQGDLTIGSDGNLYGKTAGTIFRVTPDGMLTTLWSDANQIGTLLAADNGDFYVTTQGDGKGTISRLVPPAADTAPTASITATPAMLSVGDSAVINWSSTGTGQCTAQGAGRADSNWNPTNATSGSYTFSPQGPGTATFWILCRGNNYFNLTVAKSVTLSVAPPAPVVTIHVDPTQIILGDSATLSWDASNVSDCTASGAWSGTQATNGTLNVTPDAVGTANYTLTCTGLDRSTSSATATLTTSPVLRPTLKIAAKPFWVRLSNNGGTQLIWSSSYTTTCTASGAWSGDQPTSGGLRLFPSITGFETYTLTCTGRDGTIIRRSGYVLVTR
jgi:hypothetical protein